MVAAAVLVTSASLRLSTKAARLLSALPGSLVEEISHHLSQIGLRASWARFIPNPNSALSSKRELAQLGRVELVHRVRTGGSASAIDGGTARGIGH